MLGKRYYREANRYVTPLLNSGFVVDHLLINATPIAQEYVKCAHLYCSIATILINGSMLVTKIGGCEMVHGTASTQHTVAIESLYSYMIQQNPDTIIERCTSANYVPTCNE